MAIQFNFNNHLIQWLHLDVHGAGDNAVDGWLGKRVELSILATHEVRLDDVTTAAVVLERAEVQLHRQIYAHRHHQHTSAQSDSI